MHTLTIQLPTYEKDYNNCCDYLAKQCHAHGEYIEDRESIDTPCPINAFCCPFNYESCLFVEPDDWFKVIIIDSKPWE